MTVLNLFHLDDDTAAFEEEAFFKAAEKRAFAMGDPTAGFLKRSAAIITNEQRLLK